MCKFPKFYQIRFQNLIRFPYSIALQPSEFRICGYDIDVTHVKYKDDHIPRVIFS